ncbi:MAG TPA: hypothetical protein PLV92_23815, partial [Pirellulaceae bacterium]|nr:hypothetical protein [Pirellulaceae bacterium]
MSLAAESRTSFAGDTFRRAVSATFGWNVAQRVLGLVRTLLFVVWLAPTELGRLTVVQTLLVFAAPLVVLGLPGSFGRQVEQFRQRGQLAGYLRRTLTASGGLVAGAAIAGWVYAEPLAELFLHDVGYVDSLRASVWVLVAAVLFQSSQEFLTSVHQAARAARWQLVSAALFLLFGGLFSFAPVIASTRSAFGWPPHVGIIAAYGLSLLVPSVAAWWSIARSEELWRDQHNPLDVANWLAQVAPFALGVWVTNVVASGFDGALVYGLKRWSALSPAGTDALVGHLFTARVVPTLLAGLAGMLCGVVVPYLSRDWESGGREAVFRRLRETLHGFAAVYTTVAAVTLVVGPSAARALVGPKHDVALTLLPWSLAMGGAFSQLSLAQTYFWCLGRTWLTSLALAVGLVTSLALLSITVPHADVAGAVAAGAVGHVVALVIVLQLVQRHGLPLDAWTLLAVFLPLAPGLGPIP